MMRWWWCFRLLVGGVLLVVLLGCSDVASLSGVKVPGATLTIHIVDSPEQVAIYTPARAHVRPGATVAFVNASGNFHTVTIYSGPPAVSSAGIAPGGTFQTTLNRPGRYFYRCLYHPGMTGEIDVGTPASPSPSPSPIPSPSPGG